MLRSFRARLIMTYLSLVVLPIGLLGWFMLQVLDHTYVTRLQDDMSVEANLIAASVADTIRNGQTVLSENLMVDPPSLLQSQARILLYDAAGQLISPTDPSSSKAFGQPLTEPGLDDALAGHATRGVEPSPAASTNIAYVVQPIFYGGKVVGAIHMAYSLAQIQEAQRDLQLVIVGVMVAAALAASLFGLQLTRTITRPLARLSAAATEIADGDLTHRVPVEAPSELAALARSFNRMAEDLQQAEQARQTTFANIAHDVRTPLGSIRASAEALAAGAVEQPALCERLLTGLIEQSQYLGRLTDDLLRLAAYEGGGLVLRRGNMSLTPLIEQAIRGFEARAAARSVTLARDLPASLPDVCADADRVLEILFNLLDNALAHTPPGGRICMRTESDVARGVVWIHTVDSGTGIPPQMLPHLFKRYWRSSEYGQAGSGANVGLGLSIVREIIRAHGGTITASNIPTGGADFAFCLPIAKSSTGPGVFPLA